MTWRNWAAGLVAGMLGVATAVGVAAGDDDIHACINNTSGTVREAGPKRDCAKNEIAIALSGSAKGKGGTLTINGVPFKKTGTLPNSITINGTAFKRTGTLPNSITINGTAFKGSRRNQTLTINGTAFKSSGKTLTINGTSFAPGTAAQKGDPGAQGPQGVQGPTGPPGTSHAYSATGAPTPVAGVGELSLALPAGKFAVTATVDASNSDVAPRNLSCSLQQAGALVDAAQAVLAAGSGSPQHASLPLQATTTLAAAGSLTLHCDGGGATGLTYDDLDIQAVAVDAVN